MTQISQDANAIPGAGAETGMQAASSAQQVGEGVAGAPVHLAEQAASGRVPASLVCKEVGSIGVVLFDFNPDTIIMKRNADTKTSPSVTPESILLGNPVMTITLNGLQFEGLATKTKCDQLINWTSPGGGLAGRLIQAAMAVGGASMGNFWEKQPILTFAWGPPMAAFFYQVKINTVDVTYERFTGQGVPTRAKVNLTMKEEPSLLGTIPTNPTSGGLPGRREHIVSQGDSLPMIAVQYFGVAGAWRPIAEINGIDDPTRVRPGHRIFIPNPDEFAQGAS